MFYKLRKNMRVIVIVVAIAFGASLFYGGAMALLDGGPSQQTATAHNIAVVNGDAISWPVFQENVQVQLRNQESQGARITPLMLHAVRYNTMESLINEALLMQEARSRNIRISRTEVDGRLGELKDSFPSKEIYQEQLRLNNLTENQLRTIIEDSLKVEKVLDDLRAGVTISDEEIAQTYKQVNAAHILIMPEDGSPEAKEQAYEQTKDLLAQLEAGADFAALAKEHSHDEGSRAQDGELGFFQRGQLVSQFEETAFALQIGEVSDIVETEYGYHIIKVVDIKAAEGEEFLEARDSIAEQLRGQKLNKEIESFLGGLREKADVKIEDAQIRAHGKLMQGDMDGAIEQYLQALEDYPDDPYMQVAISQAYIEKEDYDTAIAHLEKAVENASGDHQIHLMLGISYLEVEQEDKAVDSLLLASEKASHDFMMQLQITSMLHQLGRTEEAKIVDGRLDELQMRYEEQMKAMQQLEQSQEEVPLP